MPKKILIITYRMFPYIENFGDCQRMYHLAGFLSKKNLVEVIASKGNSKSKKDIRNADISFITNFFSGVFNRSNNEQENSKKTIQIFHRVILYIIKKTNKIVNKYFFNEPNNTSGLLINLWIIKNKSQIIKKLKHFEPDIVIISAPPFSLFNLISTIKKNSKAKLLLDYRDQWNYFRGLRCNNLRKKELRQITMADKVIVFSEKFRKDFCNFYKIPESKVTAIYNGFNNKSWQFAAPFYEKSKLQITYTGTYSFNENSFANIIPFLQALNRNVHKENIISRFVGGSICKDQIIWQNSLGNGVEFIHHTSQIEANKILKVSNVALLIYSFKNERSEYMLTGKFFDYLRSGATILGIGEANTNFNELITLHKLGVICKNDVSSISSALNFIYNEWKRNDLKDIRNDRSLDINFYSRDFQYQKYEELIEGWN